MYLGELRALTQARARGFNGAEILDVLGIEVDGVDIAAGVGEARVLQAVDELAQALIQLGEGEPAAQATIGPGPTELVLEARGHDLLMTLVTLAPPARILASSLLVDAHKMRAATLHAARGLLLDLLAISPALSHARLARRLGAACAQLARRGRPRGRPWPERESEPQSLLSHVHRKPEKLSIQLPPETMSRLRSAGDVPLAPLAAHIGRGSATLLRTGAPGLTWEGPVFLFLRNLLGDAERLVEAWESGEPAFTLQFGTHELRWDLTSDEVRAQGWKRALKLPPLRLAKVAAGAAELYSDETLRHGSDALGARRRRRSAGPGIARETRAPPAGAHAPAGVQGGVAKARKRAPPRPSAGSKSPGARGRRGAGRARYRHWRREMARQRRARRCRAGLRSVLRGVGRRADPARRDLRRGPLEAADARGGPLRAPVGATVRSGAGVAGRRAGAGERFRFAGVPLQVAGRRARAPRLRVGRPGDRAAGGAARGARPRGWTRAVEAAAAHGRHPALRGARAGALGRCPGVHRTGEWKAGVGAGASRRRPRARPARGRGAAAGGWPGAVVLDRRRRPAGAVALALGRAARVRG